MYQIDFFLSAGFIKLYLNEPIFYIIFNDVST